MPQDLTLIGLCGPAGSGKDTAADHLVREYGFVRASFAEAPRSMLEALLSHINADHAYLYEPRLKPQPIPVLGTSYRQLMQTLGTDWARNMLDADIWLRVLARHLGLDVDQPVHDRIVVTDIRYPNEAAWLKQHGGHLVGIQRPDAPAVRPHTSEQHFNALHAAADTTIVNSSSQLAGLHSLLDGLMHQLGVEERPALAEHPWV